MQSRFSGQMRSLRGQKWSNLVENSQIKLAVGSHFCLKDCESQPKLLLYPWLLLTLKDLIKSERLFSLIDYYCVFPSPNESNLLLLKFSIYFVNFEQLRQVSWSFAQLSTKSPSCACGYALGHVLPRQRISTWDDFMALSSLQIKLSQSISRRVNFLIPDY